MAASTATFSPRNVDPLQCAASGELTCLEFFAGIGLTHLGLSSQGWKCVYANDIEPKKRSMYKSCFGTIDHYHVEDVWETDQILARIPRQRTDLATASFPCVDLSLAGNLKGFQGNDSGAFYGFTKVLRKLREQGRLPKAVLIENVTGFLSSHNGKFLRAALRELSELGYHYDAFIVDAKHFVPQSRPRLFLLGFERRLLAKTHNSRPDNAWSLEKSREGGVRPAKLVEVLSDSGLATNWVPLEFPSLPAENRTLHKYIDLDEHQDWWNAALVKKHLAEMHSYHLDRVERLKAEPIYTVGTIYRRVRQGKSRSEIRTDGLAGCLRTPRGGSSKQIVFVAGKGEVRMRWMTPSEYARLQGCPDFPITVERNDALWGFGDAVCVPVIAWIADNVLTQLFPTRIGTSQFQQTPSN